MEIDDSIPKGIIKGAVAVLGDYVPDLTCKRLVAALREYQDDVIPLTLTPDEAAKMLNVSRPTLMKLCNRGEIRRMAIGNKVKIDRESLMAFIQRSVIPPQTGGDTACP
ncbi:MAG: helix-turn-helix domain-containing protein [Victivallales bacterium]|nr:helix-turn-helix domain-containing protein [Victivallales bacterium]